MVAEFPANVSRSLEGSMRWMRTCSSSAACSSRTSSKVGGSPKPIRTIRPACEAIQLLDEHDALAKAAQLSRGGLATLAGPDDQDLGVERVAGRVHCCHLLCGLRRSPPRPVHGLGVGSAAHL